MRRRGRGARARATSGNGDSAIGPIANTSSSCRSALAEQLPDSLVLRLSASPGSAAGRPTVVIAHTTKGKGVSFMENTVLWHYRCAKGEEFDAALKELEAL